MSQDFQIYKTEDGTISLKSSKFKESFHSKTGAKKEAEEKFINPSGLHNYKIGSRITALDVCVGMGYNTACLLESTHIMQIELNWWGLEIDKRPLTIALNNSSFKTNWGQSTFKILKAIQNSSRWSSNSSSGEIIWGDARQTIMRIPNEISFDIIFLDAFSPQQCPALWSEEFLIKLSNKLSQDGRLITYTRAAAVRASLRRAGLEVKSLLTKIQSSKEWSQGTVGIKKGKSKTYENKEKLWRSLNEMEEEHLLTNAGVPYRDPTGRSSSIQIMEARKKEQEKSIFRSTTAWKKRWFNPKE